LRISAAGKILYFMTRV